MTIYESLFESDDVDSSERLTELLHRAVQDRGQLEELFDAVHGQLVQKARQVLTRNFADLVGAVDPEELVDEFAVRLMDDLALLDVADRGQFFGRAAKNFRWILLDLLKRKQPVTLPTSHDEIAQGTGPQTRAASLDEYEQVMRFVDEQLNLQERALFDRRCVLGLPFPQIAMELGMPVSTAHHRFEEVRRRIAERFGTR